MKKSFLIICLIFCSSIINSQELQQDDSKTTVTFKIRNLGVNVDGDFSKITVKTNFDKNNPSDSYLNATIDVNTLDAGIAGRNSSLAKKEYFDVANHQFITLKSTKITKVSDTEYTLTGELTIKETTKTIDIPLIVKDSGNNINLNAAFELNRLHYKVGEKSWVMSNTVKIKVSYVAKK